MTSRYGETFSYDGWYMVHLWCAATEEVFLITSTGIIKGKRQPFDMPLYPPIIKLVRGEFVGKGKADIETIFLLPKDVFAIAFFYVEASEVIVAKISVSVNLRMKKGENFDQVKNAKLEGSTLLFPTYKTVSKASVGSKADHIHMGMKSTCVLAWWDVCRGVDTCTYDATSSSLIPLDVVNDPLIDSVVFFAAKKNQVVTNAITSLHYGRVYSLEMMKSRVDLENLLRFFCNPSHVAHVIMEIALLSNSEVVNNWREIRFSDTCTNRFTWKLHTSAPYVAMFGGIYYFHPGGMKKFTQQDYVTILQGEKRKRSQFQDQSEENRVKASPANEDVVCTGSMTLEERNAKGFANAIVI
jgi:hypothetical protein